MKEEIIMSPELARIHAHLCGDGCVSSYKTSEKDRVNRGVIAYYNKNPKLLISFRRDFSKLFNVKMTLKEKEYVCVKSIRIHNYFIDNFGKFGSREWRISNSIKEATNKVKLQWLKAFFEDEAYDEKKYNRLKTKSMNFKGLQDTKELLDSLKINSTITGPNCDGSFYLTISKFSSIAEFKGFTKEPIRQKHALI